MFLQVWNSFAAAQVGTSVSELLFELPASYGLACAVIAILGWPHPYCKLIAERNALVRSSAVAAFARLPSRSAILARLTLAGVAVGLIGLQLGIGFGAQGAIRVAMQLGM